MLNTAAAAAAADNDDNDDDDDGDVCMYIMCTDSYNVTE